MKKKLTVSNDQVVSITEGLQRMKERKLDLPAILSYKIIKNVRVLEDTYKSVTEIKNELIKEIQVDDAGIKQGTPEFHKFIEAYLPILKETNVFELDTICLGLLEGTELSVEDMFVLEFIIDEGEENGELN